MSHLFEFLTSPQYHLVLAYVSIAALLGVSLLDRRLSFKLFLAGIICLGWFEVIYLPFGYYMEPGYGFLAALGDSYEGIMSPLIPVAMSLIVGCASIIFMVGSPAFEPKPPASIPSLPIPRGPQTYH